MFTGGINLDWQCDPLDLVAHWPADRKLFMLHSARRDPNWSRFTILATPAQAVRYEHGQTRFSRPDSPLAQAVQLTHQPFDDLRQILRADRGRALWLCTLGYDLARSIEHLPRPMHRDNPPHWPDFQIEQCDNWLLHDNLTGKWSAHGLDPIRAVPSNLGKNDPRHHKADHLIHDYHAGPLTPDQSRDDVKASIRRAIEYIAAGDIFQVNLAQRFTGPFAGSPRAFYAVLANQSPAWYGAYGELTRMQPDEPTRTLASISPELFLHSEPDGTVTTRPIKGTRPSSIDPDELRHSEKDKAELAMIVDLMRNDLGRVCAYGSIRVDQPRVIESHPTVHHGVATITGKRHPSHDLVDLLRATFPGGSITGAPKVRAMQIIDELEPLSRGPYCGAIGLIHGQHAIWNVAIRTVAIEQDAPSGTGQAYTWAGGGIVADSNPDSEYQEMLDKAKAMREALSNAISSCRG